MKNYCLYMMIVILSVNCMGANAQSASKSVLQFRKKVIVHTDPEVISMNGKLTASYSFINKGNKPIKLLSVHPSCSCTTPEYTKTAIPHGGKGTISLSTTIKQLENNGMVYAVIKTDSEADTYIKLELKF